MAQDPYRYFRPEARDLVDQFAKGILELEKGGSSTSAVQRLLRLAHTLKGAARVVKQGEIAKLAHAIEGTLSPFRDSAETVGREQIDTVLEHLDEISSRIVTLVAAENAEAGAASSVAASRMPRSVSAPSAPTSPKRTPCWTAWRRRMRS